MTTKSARLQSLWHALTRVRQEIRARSTSIYARAQAWAAERQLWEVIGRASRRSMAYMCACARCWPQPELPRWAVKLSTAIVTPLLFLGTIFYVQQLISKPIPEMAGLCLSGIGIAATLAALCNGLARGVQEEASASTFTYAAEKFLHACVLLIQTLFLVFVRDSLIAVESMARYPLLRESLIPAVCNLAALSVSAFACYAWYWGFSDLNTVLWSRWQARMKAMNEARRQPTVSEGSSVSEGAQGTPSTANKAVP
jgi:hypothetical protein